LLKIFQKVGKLKRKISKLHNMLTLLLNIIFALIAIAVIYVLIFSLGSLFYKDPKLKSTRQKNSFAIYIPAYKEDAVILSTVENVLFQPTKNVDFTYDEILNLLI
jgi:cellulose synthase/poly-beta-1,6-N-acetylglucosamine synthase-like glycosyltransferase